MNVFANMFESLYTSNASHCGTGYFQLRVSKLYTLYTNSELRSDNVLYIEPLACALR